MTYDVYIGRRPVSIEPYVNAYDGDVHVYLSEDTTEHVISIYDGRSGWLEWIPTQALSVDCAGVTVYPIPSEEHGLTYTGCTETQQQIRTSLRLDVPAIARILARRFCDIQDQRETTSYIQKLKYGTPTIQSPKPTKVFKDEFGFTFPLILIYSPEPKEG